MRMPAPSAGTNPSRCASNGRLARSGSSLRVERARITQNPASPSWLMPASAPPVIITSAAPRRMISAASPIDCVDAAHAVVTVLDGPNAPNARLTLAAAILGSVIGK